MAGGLHPEQEGVAQNLTVAQRRGAAGCKMGGFLCRKGDCERGANTLWQGLRDIAVFVGVVRFARAQLSVVCNRMIYASSAPNLTCKS